MNTSACTTKRYYTLDGITVAVRDSAGSGSLNYLLGDQLGSTTVAVNASTGAVATQRYLPFGGIRSSSGAQPTDKGWIGQTRDSSTGLQYLNNRYYDPGIGRFTATDPLADLSSPGSLDAYGYAGGSPVTSSDRTGLAFCLDSGNCNQPVVQAPWGSGPSPSQKRQQCIVTCSGRDCRGFG